ncbi:MAG: SIS domain-containing protein [Actinomycetales bacterium]|nr:SIS domain-containing protein [Actinomycetales bacterium]
MNPELFRQDIEAKPAALKRLAAVLGDQQPWPNWSADSRMLFLGMGSSHYANAICAARLRAVGLVATAELASSSLLPKLRAQDIVIAVSASGGSEETLATTRSLTGQCSIIAVTNTPGSPITELAEHTLLIDADQERGGVACRSFQHTLALHLALISRWDPRVDTTALLGQAATACADIIETSARWLPDFADLLLGPAGTTMVAPAARLSSAQQSALMLREGPRRPAIACETGDWSHVDVYLTKTTDYRMLLFPGSPWEANLLRWTTERASTVVCAGADLPATTGSTGAARSLRYAHDDIDDVRLLSEVTVAELLAAATWGAISST